MRRWSASCSRQRAIIRRSRSRGRTGPCPCRVAPSSVTLALLWQDYRGQHPDGYGYSRFCDRYGEWRRRVTATMRQAHAAGEKLFVDFAGDTMPVFDAITGEVRDSKIFVAVLGASNYTYAEARFSEGLPDWIGAHVNALAFLGGVPKAIVCDNLKAGVTTASRYEPGVNRTYQDLATHYGTTIMAVVDDLEKIAALVTGERSQSPVIEDKEFDPRQRPEPPCMSSVAACRQRFEQPRHAMVEDGTLVAACLVARVDAIELLPTPVGRTSRFCLRAIKSPSTSLAKKARSMPRGVRRSISSMTAAWRNAANFRRATTRLLSRSVTSRSIISPSRTSKVSVAASGWRG